MAIEITDATFEADVLQSDKPTMIDFWAEWCGPCKMMNPVLDELSEIYKGKLEISKMNVDFNSNVPSLFNIRGIPTFIIFKDGKELGRIVGAQTKQNMITHIDKLLG